MITIIKLIFVFLFFAGLLFFLTRISSLLALAIGSLFLTICSIALGATYKNISTNPVRKNKGENNGNNI